MLPSVEGSGLGPSHPVKVALDWAWPKPRLKLKGVRKQTRGEMQKSLLSTDRLKAACPECPLTNVERKGG